MMISVTELLINFCFNYCALRESDFVQSGEESFHKVGTLLHWIIDTEFYFLSLV